MSQNLDRLVAASRPTDAEIDAEFTPAKQQQVLDRILGAPNVAPVEFSRPRRRRWPALAAAGVALLAVGALAVQTLQRPSHPAVVPSASVSAPHTTAAPSSSHPSSAKPSSAKPSPTTEAPAVEMLAKVANNAGAQAPLVIGKGQYLHVVDVDGDGGPGSVTHNMYVSADGWTWRKDTQNGQILFWKLYKPDVNDNVAIDDLPTDPVKLDAVLRSTGGTNSGDELVFKELGEILGSHHASPALRKAAILVLQRIAEHPQAPVTTKENGPVATPKVVVTRTTTADGATGYQATFTDEGTNPGGNMTLVLDETGNLRAWKTLAQGQTGVSTYQPRAVVNALPQEFIDVLGTQKTDKDVDG